MGSFRFRLEKVREHRQREVDKCSQVVAQANRKLEQAGKRQSDLQEVIQNQGRSLSERRQGTLSRRDFLEGTAWLNHLRAQEADLEVVLARTAEELSEAREELGKAWRDLEVLTRLRARRKEDWLLEQNRQHRREMDEIGQLRAERSGATRDSHLQEEFAAPKQIT